ncbi:MAG: right-handed parallel beta-helix repeat-containing protein [Nocardioides sp.]|nr:right-handed parallel beta-helix repeat-containing protein [Nocardioides sp.]
MFFLPALLVPSLLLSLPLAAPAVPPSVAGGQLPEAGISAHASATRPALHVSPSGYDSAAGTERRPLRTIAAAVAIAAAGQEVVVHGGTYHESIEIGEDKADLTLRAAPGEQVWLDGAREVTGFGPSGDDWARGGWTSQFDHSPTYSFGNPDNDRDNWRFLDPAFPMAAHPDGVWVDGEAQKQVSSASAVRPGTFFVDDVADLLVLGTDPHGRLVEASTLVRALSIRAKDVTVNGINVRRYAPSVPHMGAVTAERDGIRLERLSINDNATTGVHLMGDNIRVSRVTLAHNGMKGLGATGADHLRIDRLRAIGNNTENFNTSPSSGGAKIGRSTDIRVTRSTFRANRGTGLWFDESTYRVSVARSRMLNNLHHGLTFEISGRISAVGNLIANNTGDGINVNDTDNVRIWNNTVVGNSRPINIVQDDRDVDPRGSYRDPDLPLTWRNSPVQIRNNVISGTGASTSCLLCVEEYSRRWSASQLQITADGNLYYRKGNEDAPLLLWAGDRGRTMGFATIGGFRAATGQESRGRVFTRAPLSGLKHRPTERVASVAHKVALRIPGPVAALLGLSRGSRALGAG